MAPNTVIELIAQNKIATYMRNPQQAMESAEPVVNEVYFGKFKGMPAQKVSNIAYQECMKR